MELSIDITNAFGAIDYDNAGGLISYVNVPPIENFHELFRFEISNFVLNLIDDEVITSFKEQVPSNFQRIMTDDGLLIVKQATILFEKIKSYEKSIAPINQKNKDLLHEVWGDDLRDGDRIYDIGGRLISNPELLINLAIVSPKKITLLFSLSECTFVENYEEFREKLSEFNTRINFKLPPPKRLFDIDFSNSYTASNWDAGYRIYKEKTQS
ncbi:hypothetical protein [Pseudomonas arsenicoxydans]|uniref:Uncharacterized protein n=1 Tax=Pseudomonas arsenicoxydans TaxID=702115 RepID=A0A4P6GJ95_9PSED|nr:hypothetical protein [Pseudomonas arsenicoxydans]QAY85591.1 hypothetical protein CUN61_17085 [Pseudomonas arsenicoxydans]